MPLGLGLQSRRAQICRLYVLVVEETGRIAVIDDGAVLQDIATMGDAECHMGVLLHRGEPIEGSSRSSILGPWMRARGGGYGSMVPPNCFRRSASNRASCPCRDRSLDGRVQPPISRLSRTVRFSDDAPAFRHVRQHQFKDLMRGFETHRLSPS